MNTIVTLLALVAVLATLTACAGTPEARPTLEAETWEGVDRIHRYGDLYLASQPTPEALDLAVERGVRTLVDQRRAEEERGFDEPAAAGERGLTYANPGFGGPAELTDAILDDTRALLRDGRRPLLMHCASANRTGAVWYAYRVLDEGSDPAAALEEARAVGLRSDALIEIVEHYLERRRGGE